MNTEILLMWIMGSLGVIEIVLVGIYTLNYFAVSKLTKVLITMSDRVKKAEDLISLMASKTSVIADQIKGLEFLKNSKFHVSGDTPLGKVDVDVDLHKKDS